MRFVFSTILCANYMPQALLLADSLKAVYPDSLLTLCLFERESLQDEKLLKVFDDVVLAKDIGIEDFQRIIFKYSLLEANTAIKAHYLRYIQERYPDDEFFAYMDPDTYAYTPFTEIEHAFVNGAEMLVTPLVTRPGDLEHERLAIKFGMFNLGFIAMRRCGQTERFLDWWGKRLLSDAFSDPSAGIFTDQKWIDLASLFFDMQALRHEGYNIGPWNIANRFGVDDPQVCSAEDVRFVHYSSQGRDAFRRQLDMCTPEQVAALRPLFEKYMAALESSPAKHLKNQRWSYGSFHSGKPIGFTTRKIARIFADQLPVDPYDKSDGYYLQRYVPTRRFLEFAGKEFGIRCSPAIFQRAMK